MIPKKSTKRRYNRTKYAPAYGKKKSTSRKSVEVYDFEHEFEVPNYKTEFRNTKKGLLIGGGKYIIFENDIELKDDNIKQNIGRHRYKKNPKSLHPQTKVYVNIDSVAFTILPTPEEYGGGLKEILYTIDNFENFTVDTERTIDKKGNVIVAKIISKTNKDVDIDLRIKGKPTEYEDNYKPKGGYEISIGGLSSYDKLRKLRATIRKELLSNLIEAFGNYHLSLSRIDFAYDFTTFDIEIKQKNIKKENTYFNTTYYQITNNTKIRHYNKSIRDKLYLPLTRVELELDEAKIKEIGLDTFHYNGNNLEAMGSKITNIIDDSIEIIVDGTKLQLQDNSRLVGLLLLNLLYYLNKDTRKHRKALYHPKQNNYYKSNKIFKQILGILKKDSIPISSDIYYELNNKNISNSYLARKLKVKNTQAIKKVIDFIAVYGDDLYK